MDKKTKDLLILNYDSFNFHEANLTKIEIGYNNLVRKLLNNEPNFFKFLKKAYNERQAKEVQSKIEEIGRQAEKYVAASVKYEKEMLIMRDNLPLLEEDEAELRGIYEKFVFLSDYLKNLNDSIKTGRLMRELVVKQSNVFQNPYKS